MIVNNDNKQSVAEFILDTYPVDLVPLCWPVLSQIPGIVKPDSYNNIKRRTRPRTKSSGMTGSDKSPAIKSSKIFSLPNRMGTLLPVLETVSPNGSLFSINHVSCVEGIFMEKKNLFAREALTHVMFTVFKTADRAEDIGGPGQEIELMEIWEKGHLWSRHIDILIKSKNQLLLVHHTIHTKYNWSVIDIEVIDWFNVSHIFKVFFIFFNHLNQSQ